MKKINDIKNNFASTGKIEWIGLRALSNSGSAVNDILHVKSAEVLQNHGLVGDKAGQKPGGKRQLTLIQQEHLVVIAALMNKKAIRPEELRRNIVVSGINLTILKNMQLKIQDAIIEITGNCAPCTKMERVLGFGGFNAMRNHGGVTAKIIQGGVLNVGDEIKVLMQNIKASDARSINTKQDVLLF